MGMVNHLCFFYEWELQLYFEKVVVIEKSATRDRAALKAE